VYEDYGIYSHLDTSGICDTLRVLNLGVSPTLESEITAVFCANSLPTTILGVDVPYGTPSTTNYATVLFSSVLGCDSTVTINLIVNDTSRTDLDTLVCFGTVFDFAGNTISEAGTYFDYQTNVAGCDSVIALHVMYTPSPSTEDTLIRECGSVVYNGETYYEDANFIDTFRDVIGCDSVWRNVQIEVLYEPKDTFYVEICEGESYDFNGDIYTSSTVATQSYIYHNGCDSMITMVLTVHPLPKISLSYTSLEPQQGDLLCVLDSVRLSAEGGENYMYFNEFNEFIGSGEFVDVILPTTQNLFYAVGFSEFGCSDTTRIMIEAQPCCDLLMPNAFTPNNDGLNDFLGPVTFGNPENYRLVIFNRYGDLVFESYKVNDKWDGYYKDGQKADAGTYFYVLTGTCYDGTPIQMKGDITLIR
jgi:gliding motility-associated-like protein